jgi:predicted nucleic acid-binding protein
MKQKHPEKQVDEWLTLVEELPVTVVRSNPTWGRIAADVNWRFQVSFADAWVAALDLLRGAGLIHRDPEFDSVDSLRHLRLPYKPAGSRGRRR